MLYNTTLLYFQLSSIASRSALIAPAAMTSGTLFSFNKISMSRHFSTFFSLSQSHTSANIQSSKFCFFLNSAISIQNENINIPGKSNQIDNSANPTASFVCNDVIFANNTTPYNGAAITVTTSSLVGELTNSQFYSNSAMIGGAIFFSSDSINIIHSNFWNNSAQIGSHIFLHTNSLVVSDSEFKDSGSSTSALEITSTNVQSNTFTNCFFFQNEGKIRVIGTNVTFNLCCFMLYRKDASNYSDYIYDQTFLASNGAIILTNSTFNALETNGIVSFTSTFTNTNFANAPINDIEKCRLFPSPSQTVEAKWNSEPAIFSIVAICFFVVVSIVGIFIVTCQNKKAPHSEEDISEKELKDLKPSH